MPATRWPMMLGAKSSVSDEAIASSRLFFAYELQIRLHRKAGTGQQRAPGFHQRAVQAQRVGQMQPARDAAIGGAVAVVIDDALAPDPPQRRVFHARQDRGVLQWNAALVFEAVQGPGLHLPTIELAVMQQRMEWMLVVIQTRTDGTQVCFQLIGAEQRTHRAISRPSWATSQPLARAVANSGDWVLSTGLVVLRWMKIFARHVQRRECGDRSLRAVDAHMAHALAGFSG